ncbi:MAG: ion channel [Chitinophagales bacterium]|nr:ion channel [Chitinophagales bacterium]MDW8392690.1 ion channel [Chitinophagales bacterium]
MEHKTQPLASWPEFLRRLGEHGFFALLVVIGSLALGTIGYRYAASLSWLDSFYMACMILTGMGPVVDMPTNAGKLFSAFYALYSGIAFLGIAAILFAPILHRILHVLHLEN